MSLQTSKTTEHTTLTQLQHIIAETTGSDPEEISAGMYLEEFSPVEFPKIILKVNQDFGIHLNSKAVIEEYETVSELATLIDEESELG